MTTNITAINHRSGSRLSWPFITNSDFIHTNIKKSTAAAAADPRYHGTNTVSTTHDYTNRNLPFKYIIN